MTQGCGHLRKSTTLESNKNLLEYLARVRRELRHGPARHEKYAVIGGVLNLTRSRQPDTFLWPCM